jgi:hypothetical protein
VRRELARFGAPTSIDRIVEVWPRAVGEENARNAWPARLARDGTLHVHTADSIWAFELTQLEPQIRERLGELAPTRIRFAQGLLPEAQTDAFDAPVRVLPEPSVGDRETAHGMSAGIEDEKLRNLVSQAAAASLARARRDRSV